MAGGVRGAVGQFGQSMGEFCSRKRWFSFPEVILLAPIPIIVFATILVVDRYLKRVPTVNDAGVQWPFFGVVLIFGLSFLGLAYSFFLRSSPES
uniref:hypothetical protein n=1 Tax=Vibrio cholerae TaxID=666 RepID=UPI003F58E4A9